jgi:hypothetical protein
MEREEEQSLLRHPLKTSSACENVNGWLAGWFGVAG